MASTVFCFFIVVGASLNRVKPVDLPIVETCGSSNVTFTFVNNVEYGMVHPLQGYLFPH